MTQKVHRLDDLVVTEMSLVDRPANPGAKVLLMKRDERLGLLKTLAKYMGLDSSEISKARGDMPYMDEEDDEDMDEKTKKQLADLQKQVEDLTKAAKVSDEAAAIAKALGADKPDLDALQKRAEALGEAGADLVKQVQAKRDAGKADESVAKFRVDLPESLRKVFDGLDDAGRADFMKAYKPEAGDPVAKALADVTKQLTEQGAELAKLRKVTSIAEIKKELGDLADVVKVDEVAESYHDLRAAGHEAAAKALLDNLRALAKQAKTEGVLFKSIGASGDGDADSAEAELTKRVAKLRADKPDMSEAQAMTKVLDADPELYRKYNAEKEAR